jgi:xanthine dehydrogenase accessory factor
MRDLVDLIKFRQVHSDETLVLCTLIQKQHYGYRAVGAKKLIAASGAQCGLLSGGCLEGEIIQTALDHWNDLPLVQRFSTMAETDRFFGYQTGCPGIIDVLFEQISPTAELDLYLPFGLKLKAAGIAVTWSQSGVTRSFRDTMQDAQFFDPWIEPIQLNIVGCGPDAHVMAEFAKPMGWNLRFFDYQSDASLPVSCGYTPEIERLDALGAQIPTGPHSVVILMTHNYEADMVILKQLVGRPFGYIGCLGPRRRYDQIKADLQKLHGVTIPQVWEDNVHAPAGLFTSGRSPEEIALSIVAQIQSILRPRERSSP